MFHKNDQFSLNPYNHRSNRPNRRATRETRRVERKRTRVLNRTRDAKRDPTINRITTISIFTFREAAELAGRSYCRKPGGHNH